jgi:hypothetical protein
MWLVFEMFLKISLLFDASAIRPWCYCSAESVWGGGVENMLKVRAKSFYKFEEILSHALKNFEEQNKALDFP